MFQRTLICSHFFLIVLALLTCDCLAQDASRLVVSADGKKLLAGAQVFDINTRKLECDLSSIELKGQFAPNSENPNPVTFSCSNGINFDGSVVVISKSYGAGALDSRTYWYSVKENRRLRTTVGGLAPDFSRNERWFLAKELRGLTVYDLANPSHPEPHFTCSIVVGNASLSPTGETLAFCSRESVSGRGDMKYQIVLMETQSLTTLKTIELDSLAHEYGPITLNFGPQERYLMFRHHDLISVFDLNHSSPQPIIRISSKHLLYDTKLVVAQAVPQVLTYDETGDVRVWSSGENESRQLASLPGWDGRLSVNATGTRALVSRVPKAKENSEGGSEISLVDLGSGRMIRSLNTEPLSTSFMYAFSNDGKSFYGISAQNELIVYDSNDGAVLGDR